MYFKNFPKIFYRYNIGGQDVLKVVSDITTNIRVRKQILQGITLYDEYDIVDGETPEILADRVYGSPLYHWIIMLINDIYDVNEDWPMSSQALAQYVTDKYGDTLNDTHHYVNSDGFIVNSDAPTAKKVTNYQYEDELNESKRRIKLVSPAQLSSILTQFHNLI